MSSSEFYIKQNDTKPDLVRVLQTTNALGAFVPIDLTTATSVTFKMKKVGSDVLKVSRACDLIDPKTDGSVRLTWQDNDTDESGVYQAEFEIEFGTDRQTVPANGYMLLYVVGEVG